MRYLIILQVWLLVSFFSPQAVPAQYVLLGANIYSGRVDLLNIDAAGSITQRGHFDFWQDTVEMADAWDLVPSSDGKYLFIPDFDGMNGALYSIGEDYEFLFLKEFTGGCGSGVFSYDSKFLFFPTNFTSTNQSSVSLVAWFLNGSLCDFYTSQSMPKNRVMGSMYLSSKTDEIMGSGRFFASPDAFISYRFDREQKTLTEKQYIPDIYCLYSMLAPSDDLIGYASDNKIGTLMRRPSDGLFEATPTANWNPLWGPGGANGVVVTPDEQYLVAMLMLYDTSLVLYRLDEQKRVVYLSEVVTGDSARDAIAMTPDGRYIVLSTNEGRKLAVYRIDRNANRLVEVSSISRTGRFGCMEFLPHARPGAAAKAWREYSDAGRSQENANLSSPRTRKAQPWRSPASLASGDRPSPRRQTLQNESQQLAQR